MANKITAPLKKGYRNIKSRIDRLPAARFIVGSSLIYIIIILIIFFRLATPADFNLWQVILPVIGDSMLLAIPLVWLRKGWRKIFVAELLILTAYLFANVMYYSFYRHIMPAKTMLWWGNLDEIVVRAALKALTPTTIIAFSSAILILVGSILLMRKIARRMHITTRSALTFTLVSIAVWIVGQIQTTILYQLQYPQSGSNILYAGIGKLNGKYLRRDSYVTFNGLTAHLLHSFSDLQPAHTPNEEESRRISEFISAKADFSGSSGNATEKNLKKNFLLIVIESFESWPLDYSPDGMPVMSVLDSLIKLPDTIYYPHIVSQASLGTSSDGQMTILTGLLPLKDYAASMEFPENEYPTLFKGFNRVGRHGTYEVMCDDPKMWNQNITSRKMGFKELKSLYDIDPKRESRWSTRDKYLFAYLREYLPTLPQPWACMAVTLSLHAPYVGIKGKDKRLDSLKLNEELANYLKICKIDDTYLGELFQAMKKGGIYDNTIIAITGDHTAFGLQSSVRPEGYKEAGKYLPLIILNSGIKGGRNDIVAGQVDIYPTLTELCGLTAYPWRGLGSSLLGLRSLGAVDVEGHIIGKPSAATASKMEGAWEVSQLIITGGYNQFGI